MKSILSNVLFPSSTLWIYSKIVLITRCFKIYFLSKYNLDPFVRIVRHQPHRHPPHQTSTTPDIHLIGHPPNQTSITPDIHHTVCKQGYPPNKTMTTPDIHHTMCKIGHPPFGMQNRTSTTPEPHMVWWMSGVVDFLFYTWCGGCLTWWVSGVVDVWCGGCSFLHMVWWMSGVVDGEW